MKYVFGPVPSRRLGQSLGIDPVPLKTCNWNCVYCQLGRSRPLVNERSEYFPREEILTEIKQALAYHKSDDIDWVTFVGSGETTLHTGIGWLIHQVKSITHIPVAVITNGSLLYQPDVRIELLAADAVLPSLDAGSNQLYQKINRPYPKLTLDRLLGGLIAFRKMYHGKLWIEVMLVRDFNDSEQALNDLAAMLKQIQPDEVHILQPDRPPVEKWVQAPDEEGLLRARAILSTIPGAKNGNVAKVIHWASGSFDLSGAESLADAIIGIITRHPMREEELVAALKNFSSEEVAATLAKLATSGKSQVVERHGIRFWSASLARYRSS
ncbi:MAG TPA: radical SAM protein [Anaerolineales bacterium]|nr:radical SAM protein [Anaerolineales bacterium]